MTTRRPSLELHPGLALVIDQHPVPLRIAALEGREELSSLFTFELFLSSDEDVAPKDTIGRRASLHLTHGSRERTVHGIVRSFEHGEALGRYRATIAPAAYVLALREDCRIFQGCKAPDIIESVIAAAGLTTRDYRLALQDDYRPRDHTMQYRESDWSFLMRLIEQEGIYCYFDHADDREVLVFADHPLAHSPMSGATEVPFRPGGPSHGDARIESFRHVEELRVKRVALRGHCHERPRAPLSAQAENDAAGAAIYDAPPAFDAPESGPRLARLRLEQEVAAGGTAHATSDCLSVTPGVIFGLVDHPCDSLNRSWLVTGVEHRLVESPGAATEPTYDNRLRCIPSDVPFRSHGRAPRPAVGIQTATVVGPAGQDVHCDALGRVKVRFHWDRNDTSEAQSSSWVRVGQAWAGPGYGALFIPRVGHQVLVDFADGDPDRPIIVGSVYDGENLPPAALPRERTATVLRSLSSPGGEGKSELRMEAESGHEHVLLESCRDLAVRVGQDKDETVTRNERAEVAGNRARIVAGIEAVTVGGNQAIVVRADRRIEVTGNDHRAIAGAQTLGVGGNRSLSVSGQHTEVVGDDLTLRVGGDKVERVSGSSREAVEGERLLEAHRYDLDVTEAIHTNVEGDHDERAAGTRRIEAGEIIELSCGEATITAHQDGTITLVGKRVRVKVTGPVEVEGKRLSVRSQGSVNVRAAGSVSVRGRGVDLN